MAISEQKRMSVEKALKDVGYKEEVKKPTHESKDFSKHIKKTIDSGDVIFEDRTSLLQEIQHFLFCQDNSMLRLISQRRELNKSIYEESIKEEQSRLRKELKGIVSKIRENLRNQKDFTPGEINSLITEFKKWVHEPLFLTFYNEEKNEFCFHRAAKRGNSIYRRLIKEKLKQRTEFFEDPRFEKLLLREEDVPGYRKKKLISNTLFLTLTWNPNIFFWSKKRAWLSLEYFYNKFITRFRKKYGRCWVLKGVESTKLGFPHIHLLLICKNSFDVFVHKNKDTGKKTYRIKEKPNIAKSWNSHIDILVPSNVQSVRNYVVKDILSQYDKTEKRRTTQDFLSLALCWLFRKQSYAISGFSHDLITERLIQTQIDKILSSNQAEDMIYCGIVKIEFSIPYLKQHKGKPPPDIFSVSLAEEKKDSLNLYMLRKPNQQNLKLQRLKQIEKLVLLEQHLEMHTFLEEQQSPQQRSRLFLDQIHKRFSRYCKLQAGEKIKVSDLDLTDHLNLLAYGKC